MVLQSAMSRLVVLSLVVLSLGLLVHASPIAVSVPAVGNEIATLQERTRKCYAGSCFGGIEIVKLMLELERAIKLRLRSLDKCLQIGGYEAVILEIEALLYAAIEGIHGYNIGLLGLLTGKSLIVAKIWARIVILIATHCGKWYGRVEYDVFLGLIARIDLALKLCLEAIIGMGVGFGGLIRICGPLFARAHIALLLRVKFGVCLGFLGLRY
ncbi:hypothetical protein CTheo_5236 [Ceratobasidium theobromae]|uniref:Transmembrane protein n=1 Tax=Ceratobasidium theobromae TaxID=1582974 RepID=A0A5N5QHW6_9AGAM|nr:hypothetical protein CTheo_5236 [Ceratobasidium theobromae]